MGKAEEEHVLPSSALSSDSPERNADNRLRCLRSVWRLVRLKCVLILLLSVALFLSAVFWLPPFLRFADRGDLDLDSKFKDHDIVATFRLMKPVSLLEDNIFQLGDAIYDEINIPSKVVFLSLKFVEETNRTQVIFAIDPEAKHSKISEPDQSLISGSFKYFVLRQLTLHLTPLFGDAEQFEVLKFPGGITIIPPQSAFLLQKVQIHFNFTLNFSISEIQIKFEDLTSQLKSGLHLAPYENLYVSLTNTKGSTIDAPTIVQSSVVLAVGNPSNQRLRQLAQTITSPHSKNLGLNNTVFGKVKQVRLSSVPQQYLHGGDGSPSPAPAPQHHHHHHHHRHHHNHHHHHIEPPAPAISPESPPTKNHHSRGANKGSPPPNSGAPAPQKSSPAARKSNGAHPPGCHSGYRSKGEERRRPPPPQLAPALAPSKPYVSPHHRSAASPRKQAHPSKSFSNSVPVSSPLPSVVFAHSRPPSKSKSDDERSDTGPALAPTPSTSSAGSPTAVQLSISLFVAVVLHL